MKKQTVLIVDREQNVRHRIRQHTKFPHYKFVFWECSNGFEAIKYINDLEPDLLFIDINIPGINGFDVIETVAHLPSVIFISDCGKDAAKAFGYQAIDYLIKPLAYHRIQLALERFHRWNTLTKNLPTTVTYLKYSEFILLEKGFKFVSIPISEITYMKADKDYTWIHTITGESYLSTIGIGQIENRIDPNYFLRIHRSYIINIEYIQELYRDINKFTVVLSNSIKINVGRNYLAAIKKLMF